MAMGPQRTIREVLFDKLGPLSVEKLMAMPPEQWESLRAKLTDGRAGSGDLAARCIACAGPVYIAVSRGRPLFVHFQGSDPRCPWYTGKNMHPDDARAAQYRGQQESEMHRRMCHLIAELAELDERCVGTWIDQHLPSSDGTPGRYPDVLVEWRGFGKFVVEYQMSHTFQTEVSQRTRHYQREGIPLLWVLSSFDPGRVPQAVSDVVHRHRGNAFVLDHEAVLASRRENTLVLSCHLSNGSGYDPPLLVRFDALNFRSGGPPYMEDRVVGSLLRDIGDRRHPFFPVLKAWDDRTLPLQIGMLENFPDRRAIDHLVAAAFSIAADANGKPRNYASRHPNIKGMLNSYQETAVLARFAVLLKTFIGRTAANYLLEDTVGTNLERSIRGHRKGHIEQAGETSPEWELLRYLFPEVLDPFVRQQLIDAGALPPWADPDGRNGG